MNWVRLSRPLRLRLVLCAGFAAIVLGAAIQWSDLSSRDRSFVSTMNGDLAFAELASQLYRDVLQLRRFEKDIFIHIGDRAAVDEYRVRWDEAYTGLRRDLLRTRTIAPAAAQSTLESFANSVGNYRAGFERSYGLVVSGRVRTTAAANEEMNRYKSYVHATEAQIDMLRSLADQRISRLDSMFMAREGSLVLGLLLVIGASLTFGAALLRSAWSRSRSASA